MLQITSRTRDAWNPELEFSSPPPPFAGFGEILGILRRRARTIGGVLALTLLAGAMYAFLATPRYMAISSLFIDARKAAQQTILGDPISDSAILESQVEVVRSQTIALAVIDKLRLTDDPEFNGTPTNPIAVALHGVARFFTGGDDAADRKLAAALRNFGRDLDVQRMGLSYVLQIRFVSNNAAKAAQIANAVVSSYLDEVLTAKFQSAEKANGWLQQQMDELRKRTLAATAAVQEFKSKAELVDSDRGALENNAKLRDLEAVAQSDRAIYDDFVHRYAETLLTSSPTLEARVITHALPPEFKSWPRVAFILPGAAFFGAVLGCLIALFQERLDRSFHAPAQVENELGIECIGLLPISPTAARSIELHDAEERKVPVDGVLHHVLDSPLSLFSETMRSIKVAIDRRHRACSAKVVGVTSTFVGEGKTTAAFNLAAFSAEGGTRTLLIDADLRSRQLTRMLAGHVPFVLRDLLLGRVGLERAVLTHPATGLDILPLAVDVPHPEALLLSPGMQELFTQARAVYDLVVVDLPAIAPTVDARATTHLLDAVLLIIHWGKTSRDAIGEALARCEIGPELLLGVVLNKVDLNHQSGSKWPQISESCTALFLGLCGLRERLKASFLFWNPTTRV